MPHSIDTGARSNITPPVTSNGGTAQPFGPTASAGQTVYVGALLFRNNGSVTHTVQLLSSGGDVLCEFDLAAKPSGLVIDGRSGRWETKNGESLQFKFTDGGGSAADVVVSGHVVQR